MDRGRKGWIEGGNDGLWKERMDKRKRKGWIEKGKDGLWKERMDRRGRKGRMNERMKN